MFCLSHLLFPLQPFNLKSMLFQSTLKSFINHQHSYCILFNLRMQLRNSPFVGTSQTHPPIVHEVSQCLFLQHTAPPTSSHVHHDSGLPLGDCASSLSISRHQLQLHVISKLGCELPMEWKCSKLDGNTLYVWKQKCSSQTKNTKSNACEHFLCKFKSVLWGYFHYLHLITWNIIYLSFSLFIAFSLFPPPFPSPSRTCVEGLSIIRYPDALNAASFTNHSPQKIVLSSGFLFTLPILFSSES